MKRQVKRYVAMLLCMLMLLEMFPTSVFAGGISNEIEFSESSMEETEEDVQDSTESNMNVSEIEEHKETETLESEVEEITKPTEEVAVSSQESEESNDSDKIAQEENVPMIIAESDVGISVASEIAEEETYEQFLANYLLTYKPYLVYRDDVEELPYHTFVNNADSKFEETVNAWRVATLDAESGVEYSTQEMEFYQLLVFDILYEKVDEDVVLNNVETAVNALQSSTLKSAAEAGFDWTLSTEVTNENADALLNQLIAMDNFKFIADKIEILKKATKYTSTVEELITKLYMLMQLDECSTEVKIILEDLYSNADDKLLKEGCRKVAQVASGLMNETEIIAIFSGEVVVQEASSYVLGKIWDGIMNSTSLGQSISIGQAVGKMCSNILFSTEATIENWYSMKQVYKFETLLKRLVLTYQSRYESNPTIENAKIFCQAVKMYLSTLSIGMGYAINYAETVNGTGVAGWIYKNITHKDDYERVKLALSVIRSNINYSIEFINNETYNLYLEAKADNIPWEETSCTITLEQINEDADNFQEELFELCNQTVNEDTSYSEDKLTYANYYVNEGILNLNGQTLTVYGDLYFSGGTINLAGGTLDVRGNVYQSGGTMLIAKGTLKIGGDYRIQKTSTNSAGDIYYTYSSGILQMNYIEDRVYIGKSFIMQSNEGTGSGVNSIGAGIMTVAGDFIQLKGTSSSLNNVKAGPTHTLVLNGTGEQRVSFEQSSCFLGILEIAETADVTFSGYLSIAGLQSDAEVKSDGLILNNIGVNGHTQEMVDIGLNGHTLKIKGDVTTIGTMNLCKGKLHIEGNLLQPSGLVILNKGTLETTGDYRIQNTATNSAGDTYYTYSSGILQMNYAEDRLYIGKSFIMQSNEGTGSGVNSIGAGIMTVAGDFIQLKGTNSRLNNIKAGPSHTLILNGTGKQRVSFEQSSCFLGILEIAETADITFSGYLSIAGLQSDAEVKSDGLILNNVGVNGHTQEMNTIGLNGHTLKIKGDVTTIGTMNLCKGKLCIEGDLLQPSGVVILNKGTLETTGDYRIQTATTNSAGDIKYTYSSGVLQMNYAEDRLYIGKNFIMQSNKGTGSGTSANSINAGIMTVAGDFTQLKGNSSSLNNIKAGSSHTLILNGTGEQRVSFEQSSCFLGILEIEETADVTFSGYLSIAGLQSDAEVKSDGLILNNVGVNGHTQEMNTIGLNGHTLKIKGDVTTIGTMNLCKGKLCIEGDLLQPSGVVILNKGTLETAGDYRIQTSTTDGAGDKYYTTSSGILQMQYSNDKVIINGDFYTGSTSSHKKYLTAGTLYVRGDFFEVAGNTYNFASSVTHTVVLCGTEPQSVSFASNNSCFNILKLSQNISQYTFNPNPCWNTLEENYKLPIELDKSFIAYGSCGENLNWTLNQDGLLHIYGTGVMDDWDVDETNVVNSPWKDYASKVVCVVCDSGITQIGKNGFRDTNIVSIELPDTLISIGDSALRATEIESIVIPDSVKTIGMSAFKECKNLVEVVLPKDLTLIAESTFEECRSLDTLQLFDKVQRIESCAFKGCESLEKIEIPESVSYIGLEAFSQNVADSNLGGTKTIYFKGSVPEISSNAFLNVVADAYYPGEKSNWTSDVLQNYGGTITWIPITTAASGYCGYPTWTLSSDGVLRISGNGTMKNYANKTAMPWYDYRNQIKMVIIENGVTSIGNYAFYGMPNLINIKIAKSVITIGDYAFKNATALDGVILPSGLTSLGDSAFYGCSSLTVIEIPANLYTVKPYTFKNCTSLASVTFHEGNLMKLSDGAFYNTALTEVTFPACLDIIDVYCFKNCGQLASIIIPEGDLTEIREAVFYGTAIPSITIPEGIKKIGSYVFKNCTKLITVDLPETLTSVGEASFYACTALESITLPDAVTTIGNYAFRKCTALASVAFGEGLLNIGESSFYGCTSLTTLTIPENVTTIQAYAFKGCTGVTDVTLSDALITIGDSAFHTCTGIKTMVIPAQVETIGEYCFSGSYNLWQLTFEGDAPAIGSGAFKGLAATAYYPADNTTWTADVMDDYGGTINWSAK